MCSGQTASGHDDDDGAAAAAAATETKAEKPDEKDGDEHGHKPEHEEYSTRRRIDWSRMQGWAPSAADTRTKGESAMAGRFDARVTGSGWWWKRAVFGGKVPWRTVASSRAGEREAQQIRVGEGGDAGMEEEVEVEQRLRVERTQDLGEVMQQQKQRRRDRASVVWCCFCVVERSGAQCSVA